ncbi:MAG: hypothetical protein ACPG4Z_04775, partial [Chitinophagales bacterium]
MTNKTELSYIRSRERRNSRIKETRNFIIENTSSSILNNQKWYKIFDWIEKHSMEFTLKTLLSLDEKKYNFIFELEESSILLNNSGDFFDFLELETLTLKSTLKLKVELQEM